MVSTRIRPTGLGSGLGVEAVLVLDEDVVAVGVHVFQVTQVTPTTIAKLVEAASGPEKTNKTLIYLAIGLLSSNFNSFI